MIARVLAAAGVASEEVGFARDSPLEENGFELVVPRHESRGFSGASLASRAFQRFDRGVKAEATMMGVAVHSRDPRQVVGVSKAGQVFTTGDGGEGWSEQRLPAGAGDR
jgi:hypothetical protein